jgi:hypothetical protein
MLAQGVKIHFAHRTFSWNNEARGKAAVHCVIVGFGLQDVSNKTIYEYDDIKGEPHAVKVSNINPYLVDAPDILLDKLSNPISNVPSLIYGSEPREGGFLLFSDEEKKKFIEQEPSLTDLIKPFVTADNFINGANRWCFWLVGISPSLIRTSKILTVRLNKVKEFRLNSLQKQANAAHSVPGLFVSIRQPSSQYLLIPIHSSENRNYIPIGYMPSEVITSNANFALPNASFFTFGILTSFMHNAWVRAVCGRLESRYRYSAGIVYNNFPWPEPSDKQRENIEAAAQAVLDARAAHLNATLADLYDPLTMPANLLKAHQVLYQAVDAAYGYKGAGTDAARVAFLFERYQAITSLLPAVGKARKTRKQ